MSRVTHSYVLLPLSRAAYDEIRTKLENAGYKHAILDNGRIDMHGLAVVRENSSVQIDGEELDKR